jgi:hypothetical protein
VWDSTGVRGRRQSQAATSGMVQTIEADGSRVYACNDIGANPTFEKLIFRLTIRDAQDN